MATSDPASSPLTRALDAIDKHYEEHKREREQAVHSESLYPPRAGFPNLEQEVRAIDSALTHALAALESDSTLEQRREAFSEIQDLYEPGRLLASLSRESGEQA